MVADADTDGDGRLGLDDFTEAVLAARVAKEGPITKDDECMCHVGNAFRTLDINDDGKVDASELFRLFKHLDDSASEVLSGFLGEGDDNDNLDEVMSQVWRLRAGRKLGGTHVGIPPLHRALALPPSPPAHPHY